MRQELVRRGLKFEQFFPVRSGFVLDFAFPDKRIGIECDGDLWHPLGNKRDRFRDWMLRRGGWKVLRFRESEIVNNISECVDKIQTYL
jgi:very-short-patch-repair endonuclease